MSSVHRRSRIRLVPASPVTFALAEAWFVVCVMALMTQAQGCTVSPDHASAPRPKGTCMAEENQAAQPGETAKPDEPKPPPSSPWKSWKLVTTLLLPLFACGIAFGALVGDNSPSDATPRTTAPMTVTVMLPPARDPVVICRRGGRAADRLPDDAPARAKARLLTKTAQRLAKAMSPDFTLAKALRMQAFAWARRDPRIVRRAARRSERLARRYRLPSCGRLARRLGGATGVVR